MPIIDSKNISGIVERTLNRVDTRLVNHGKRVAFIVLKMLRQRGGYSQRELQNISILAMLHDIGAYKTEEIDHMVQFETSNIWEHSVYGYLFILHLSPLSELAQVILFHHLDYRLLKDLDVPYKDLAQIFYLADRVDIYLEDGRNCAAGLAQHLKTASGTRFDPAIVQLFLETEEAFRLCDSIHSEINFQEMLGGMSFTEEEIDTYLKMLIFSIDFRSNHTVTHTITTTYISKQVARLMGLDAELQRHVFYGALLHDLGKIGIPVEILEFPGKLSPQAMQVMRTHVGITEEILDGSIDEVTTRIALRHHEKLDGSGYPRGLRGGELTIAERIVAIADIVSALCGTRSYKEAFPKEKTLGIIGQMSRDGLLDSQVVSLICGHFDEIMSQVREACDPILSTYLRIHQEYEHIMAQIGSQSAAGAKKTVPA